MTNYDEVKYNDLKSLAKERGLDASGTKEELKARLIEADGGAGTDAKADDPVAPEATTDAPEAPAEEPKAPKADDKPVISPAVEAAETRKADKALRDSAREMKAALDKQPKVSIMIPFEAGENPEQGKKVPFHCNLNGYAQDFPRGEYIEVPQQIADLIKERLQSEGKIGAQWRIDRDSRKVEALS